MFFLDSVPDLLRGLLKILQAGGIPALGLVIIYLVIRVLKPNGNNVLLVVFILLIIVTFVIFGLLINKPIPNSPNHVLTQDSQPKNSTNIESFAQKLNSLPNLNRQSKKQSDSTIRKQPGICMSQLSCLMKTKPVPSWQLSSFGAGVLRGSGYCSH